MIDLVARTKKLKQNPKMQTVIETKRIQLPESALSIETRLQNMYEYSLEAKKRQVFAHVCNLSDEELNELNNK